MDITILTADQALTKTFEMVNGEVKKQDYGNAYQYNYTTISCSNIYELSELLTELESWKNSCVIRGELIDPNDANGPVLRRKDAYDGKKAYFKEATRSWGCFDFDKIPCPEYCETQEDMLLYIVALLGPEFHNVTFHYQWSSSAGTKGWDTISCHLWYWLEEPRTDSELQRWAIEHGEVDDAPFRTVQPNYTATPNFINMQDPLDKRSGLMKFAKDAVIVPIIPEPTYDNNWSNLKPSISFQQRLDEIGPRYHMPIQRAIASYVAKHGTQTNVVELKQAVKEAIWRGTPGRDSKQTYLKDRYLDQSINGAMRKYGTHTPTQKTKMQSIREQLGKIK